MRPALLPLLLLLSCAAPGGGSSTTLIRVERQPAREWHGLPQGTVGEDAIGRVTLKDLGPPEDPPPVAKAVELRKFDPRTALSMLRETWLDAVKRRDLELAAYALDRSGDILMDLRTLLGNEPALATVGAADGVKERDSGCTAAHDDYLRAYGLAEVLGDRRLLGRIAHDIAWAGERCSMPKADVVRWYEVALAHRLAVGDAGGVRFSANNLGRIIEEPKWRRLELYALAWEGAKVTKDDVAQRKTQGNMARLWFYSRDARWLSRDAGVSSDDYSPQPLRGEVRKRFLTHLKLALEAGARAGESASTVCEGILLYSGPPCDEWDGRTPEALFPEGHGGPTR